MSGLFSRNKEKLKTTIHIVFGFVWLIDGALKFQPGMPTIFSQLIQNAAQGQPSWLMLWFNFWLHIVSGNPVFWVYFIGISEVLLGLALIAGLMRKTTYLLGALLSLFIWAIPEGLGGPYGPSSTDIGTGIIYALVFIALMLINAGYGPSKLSFDYWLEKRIKWWKKIAEFE